jgi:enolase
VLKAVANVNDVISKKLAGIDATDQALIDNLPIEIDGTENKSNLGANATLGVSIAVARASAVYLGLLLYRHIGGIAACELPVPQMNVNKWWPACPEPPRCPGVQIVPPGATSFREALRMGVEVFHTLKGVLKEKGHTTGVGDEGGFAPQIASTREALDLLVSAIEQAGYRPKEDILIALDPAASEFFKDGKYHVDGNVWDSDELIGSTVPLSMTIPSFP